MTWANFTDVTSRWVGNDVPTDEELVTALIADAETVILSEYPRIQERIDSDALSIDVVKLVVARMVSRVLRNPENLTYWQQNTGPFGQGRSFGDDKDIWLSLSERKMLAPVVRGKAFSLDTAPNKNSARYYIVPPETTEPVWIEWPVL